MSRFPRLRRPPEWGVEPVPESARTLRTFDIFVLWSSLGVGLLVLAAGTLLVLLFGLTLFESVAIALAGSVIGSLLLAAAARPGSRAGVPTMVSLRPVLGRTGSYLPSALNVFQLLGWAAFELLIMGIAASILVTGKIDPVVVAVSIPLFGAVVAALALGGPLAVVRHWLEKFAIWLVYGSTIAIVAFLALQGVDWNARAVPGAFLGTASLLLALDLVIVMPISWWPLVADYNRFARSPRDSTVGTTLGYTISNAVFYVLGAWLVVFGLTQHGQADFLAAMFLLFGALFFLPPLLLLLILVDETDNAFANVYSTAVSFQNLAPKRRQAGFIAVAALIAVAAAWTLLSGGQGIGGDYELFLILIGGFFVPLLGVLIADAYLVRRMAYGEDEYGDGSPGVRWPALASWFAGIALYLSIAWGLIPGFPPVGATLPSFLLAVSSHVALSKVGSTWAASRRSSAGRGGG